MNENKTSTAAGIRLIINAVLYVVWAAAPVLLLTVLMCLLVNGEFVMAPVPLAGLVLWVIFSRIYSKRYTKFREKEEEAYRAENLTPYTVDCGWLGTLNFAFDKRLGQSVIESRLPDIFCMNETAAFISDAERVNGKFVELTVNRLFAERGIIFQGVVQEFNRIVDRWPDLSRVLQRVNPSGLQLLKITVTGSSVTCELALLGLASDNIFADVTFDSGILGYRIELKDEENV